MSNFMDLDFTADGNTFTLQFYKNPKHYPTYTENIVTVGTPKTITPRNINMRTGFFDLQVDYSEITGSNYIGLTRSGFTMYAYIDHVEHVSGDKQYRFHYNVDPLRTYKNKVELGNQFVLRGPDETELYDEMLGSLKPENNTIYTPYTLGDATKRYLVVQVRRDPSQEMTPTPVQPSPYNFFVAEYPVAKWTDSSPVFQFINAIAWAAEPENIATTYSIPYADLSGLQDVDLPVTAGGSTTHVSGWKLITSLDSTPWSERITLTRQFAVPEGLTRVDHKAMIVIPEAGIMEIPDEALYAPNLALRQDIDLFSGAANYMLESHNGDKRYHLSARGSAVNTIPIVSDPLLTYLSQNQSALTTSILGDVAMAGGGILAMKTGQMGIGAGMLGKGALSAIGSAGNAKDAARHPNNPPAFLGSALAGTLSQRFWTLFYRPEVTNAELVHSEFGYPRNILEPLTIPSSGYIQTQGCAVKSDGTVPQWAITEINGIFDNGLKVE